MFVVRASDFFCYLPHIHTKSWKKWQQDENEEKITRTKSISARFHTIESV